MSQGDLFMPVTDTYKRNGLERVFFNYYWENWIISIKSILSVTSFQTLNDFTGILNVNTFYFSSQDFQAQKAFSSCCSSIATKPQMCRPASFLCNTIPPKNAWLIMLTAVPHIGRLFSLARCSASYITETLKPFKAITVVYTASNIVVSRYANDSMELLKLLNSANWHRVILFGL